MKTFLSALTLCAALFIATSASAEAINPFARGPMLLGTNPPIPPEWAGVWSVVDSLYDCSGGLTFTFSGFDTLCAGVEFENDPTYNCTGSATATAYHQDCTGSGNAAEDCDYLFQLESNGTRTADSYFSVSTINTQYTGTGCGPLTTSCTQINVHATRIGPAPPAYCASPAHSATWGELKGMYR